MIARALASLPKRMCAPPSVRRVMRMPVLPRSAMGSGVSASAAPVANAAEDARRKARRSMGEVYTSRQGHSARGIDGADSGGSQVFDRAGRARSGARAEARQGLVVGSQNELQLALGEQHRAFGGGRRGFQLASEEVQCDPRLAMSSVGGEPVNGEH